MGVSDHHPLISKCSASMQIAGGTDPATLDCANAEYTLLANLTSESGNAITITAQNVTLDCDGFSITGPGSSYVGVYSYSAPGAIMKNCHVSGFEYGAYYRNSSLGQVVDSEFTSNSYGLLLSYIYDDDYFGSDNNLIARNNFTGNYYGFYLDYSDNNIIENNTVANTSASNFGTGSCPFLYLWNG